MSGTYQVDFKLKTSSSRKTVHLLGSWDGYKNQLPMSKDGDSHHWKGTFRFPDKYSQTRQWYYYILDGYKHTHNPDEQSVNERTTGRELNILEPPGKYSMPSSRSSRPSTIYGRPISPSQITHPRPSKPQQAYNHLTLPSKARDLAIETLSRQLRHQVIDSSDESEFSSDNDSLPSDQPSSHTSSSDDESDSEVRTPDSYTPATSRGFSPPTSASSPEADYEAPLSQCYCGIHGITRTGERIKIDCYGQRCGYKKSRCTAKSRSAGGSGSGSGSGSSSESGREYKVKVETKRPTMYKDDRYEVRSTRRR